MPPGPPAVVAAPPLPLPASPSREGNSPREIAARARAVAAGSVARAEQAVHGHNILAIVALLVSCLGIITYACAPTGAVLGHLARRQIRARNQAGGGIAMASILIGWGFGLTYVPKDVLLRQDVVNRLLRASRALPCGFDLVVLDGWRSPRLTSAQAPTWPLWKTC